MNSTKKILLAIYGVFVLIVLYQSATKEPTPEPASVRIISDATSYTLPKTPIISLVNNSEKSLTVDTCRDLKMMANGEEKATLPPTLCRIVEAPAKSITPLIGQTKEDIFTFQDGFQNLPETSLRFTYTQPESTTKTEVNITLGKAGFIRLFFRTFFYNPVYNFFAALVIILPGHSLGWAIITITLIIRLALLIPQQKMLVSQRRMQVIQPKIKAIQEQHKGDQAQIGMKMMELYKKEWVNPLGSCLPILIQIPILIVLYQVILNIGNPSNLAHLYHIDWLQSFRNVTINSHFFGLELGQGGGIVGIVLGVLTGGLQFGQMWLSQKKIKAQKAKSGEEEKPKDPNMPDMQQMQKMMLYIFPAMAGFLSYKYAAGIGLYWLIGTVFMIIQQAIANRQAEDKKMVIRDKAGNVIG